MRLHCYDTLRPACYSRFRTELPSVTPLPTRASQSRDSADLRCLSMRLWGRISTHHVYQGFTRIRLAHGNPRSQSCAICAIRTTRQPRDGCVIWLMMTAVMVGGLGGAGEGRRGGAAAAEAGPQAGRLGAAAGRQHGAHCGAGGGGVAVRGHPERVRLLRAGGRSRHHTPHPAGALLASLSRLSVDQCAILPPVGSICTVSSAEQLHRAHGHVKVPHWMWIPHTCFPEALQPLLAELPAVAVE